MQTARAPLALFVRVLVAVQILLGLSNPLAPLAAAPTVPPAVKGPRLDFDSLLAPFPRNAPSPAFASPLPTPAPTPVVALPTPEPTPQPQLQADPIGTVGPAGGRLSSPDDRVTLEFPPGAVDAAVEVQYRLRRTLPLTTTQQGIALRFDLDAYGRDAAGLPQPVTRFARPLTLTVSLTGLVSLERLEGVGRPFLAYVGPDGRWVEVLVHANRRTGVLTAQVDHLSGWGTGVTTPNMWTLTYNPPQADLFTGAASYRIPIQVPAGRDGVQPQLALSYNSRRLDGQDGSNTPPANPLPEGWSLDVMDITRDRWWWCDWDNEEENGPCFGDVFSLILNGTAYELYGPAQQYGRYYAKDAPQLYIYRRNDCDDGDCNSQNGAPNTTGEYWIVRQPDGTEARLGYRSDAEQVTSGICPNGPGCGQYGYRGRVQTSAARRWRVDTITSTYGYTTTFEYDEYADNSPQDSRSTLRRILYNGGLTEVGLAGDGGAQPTINTVVVTNTSGSGVKTMVRKYVLGRGQMTKGFRPECGHDTIIYTTLSSVQEYGLSGVSAPAQVFTYTLLRSQPDDCDCPLPRLTSVANGYGGLTDVAYESDGVPLYTWRVQGVRSSGGVAGGGPAISTTFAYGPACYDKWIDDGYNHNTNPCASRATLVVGPGATEGPVVGHSAVTQTHWSGSGALLARSTHQFHIDQAALVGRERQVRQLDPAGALLQQQDTQWISTTFGLTTTFTYAVAVTTTQGGQASRVTYEYDPAQQGGVQYGNRTAEYYHGDLNVTGDERTVRRLYYPMTSIRWIVNAPARETVYTGAYTAEDANVAGRTCYQYDGLAYGQAPITGSLTAESRWQGLPAGSACTNLSGYVTTRASYDVWGNPVVVTDALSHTTRTQYDSQYRLFPIVITDAVTSSVRYDYDWARGLVLTMTDANSAATGYRYDALGRLTKVFRPGDTETYPTVSYVYADGVAPWKIETWQRETSGCSGCTRPIFSYYDGLGRLLQTRAETVNGSQQAVTNVVYDALGRKESEYLPEFESYTGAFSRPAGWDARPRTTTQYDALGRPVRVVNPDSTDSTTMYAGWSTSQADANGHYKMTVTDAYGRLGRVDETATTLEDPFTSMYTGTWTFSGHQSLDNGAIKSAGTGSNYDSHFYRITDTIRAGMQERGVKVEFKVDGTDTSAHLMLEVSNDPNRRFGVVAAGGKIYVQYNATGSNWVYPADLIIPVEVGQWYVLTLRLAPSGRAYVEVWRKSDPARRGACQFQMPTGLNYRFHHWIYRGNDWLDNYHELSYQTTTYAYDALDHLTRVTDTLTNTTVITYNALGLKTGMRDPDMGVWSYAYDAAGNLVTQTDALTQVLWFKYDALNRVIEKRQTGIGGLLLASYGYDAGSNGKGRRTTMTVPNVDTASWAYDARGRVLTETKAITGGGTFATSFGYDAMDRVVTMTYPTGEVITQAYNAAGQLAAVRSPTYNLSYASGLQYNAMGQLTQMTYGNAAATAYTYESLSFRLKRIQVGSLLDLNYGYDPVGNVKAITDTTNSGQVQRFGYDALDRLVSANAINAGGGQYTQTYLYNPIGNITGRISGTLTTSYWYSDTAHKHAVTGLSNGGAYQYDLNGNMTRRVEGGVTYTQTWDVENRLSSVTVNGQTTQFYYDGDGQRVKEVEYQNVAAGISATSSGTLIWPRVVTNGDTWADSGASSSGEYAYTTETGLQYIQLDLGAVHTVDQVKVWHYAADGRTYHNTKTQVSADGNNWNTVFDSAVSGEYAETAAGRAYLFAAQSVRYVRDYLNGSTANPSNHWVEVEAWGTATRVHVGPHCEKNVTTGVTTTYYLAGAQRVATRMITSTGSVVYYIHADHLGSASLTTDASGAKYGELRYMPYGETRYVWGSTPTDRRFTGQREESALGSLYDYGARFYSSSLNRFISPDTIVPSPGNPQSLNRYSYVLNNALKYTDPTGHNPACGYGGGSCEEGGGPLWPVEIKQAPSDALDNVAAVTEGIASVLFEPADWVITGRDCLTGHCSPWMLLGLLPLVPSSLAGRVDDAVDAFRVTDELGDAARAADNADGVVLFGRPKEPSVPMTRPGPDGKVSCSICSPADAIRNSFHREPTPDDMFWQVDVNAVKANGARVDFDGRQPITDLSGNPLGGEYPPGHVSLSFLGQTKGWVERNLLKWLGPGQKVLPGR